MWEMLRFYIPFTLRYVVSRRSVPLFYGIVLTNRCNLNCRGCHISDINIPDMNWDQLVNIMRKAWEHGISRVILHRWGTDAVEIWRMYGKRCCPDG